jgi:hypothetical protein
MRRLFTPRIARDDRIRRGGIAVARRWGLSRAFRSGLHIMVAAAVVLAAGMLLGPGESAASSSPAGFSQDSPPPPPSPYGQSVCTPQGAGESCSGTYGGNAAYDPLAANGAVAGPPTVSVSQVTNLTNQLVNVSWTNFTPTTYTSPFTTDKDMNAVTVMECRSAVVDGRQVPPIDDGAYNAPSSLNTCYDMSTSTNGPNNLISGYTSPGGIDTSNYSVQTSLSCELPDAGSSCGTGSVQFRVENQLENSFLGCNATTECYLVVMPNWGGDDGSSNGWYGDQPTDPLADMTFTTHCSDHTGDGANLFQYNGFGSHAEWNTSCTWADRFVFPLSFSPSPSQFCSSNDYQFYAEGSPELEQAMQQWTPAWCSSKQGAVDFDYNSGDSEYAARSSFLSGGNGALSSGTDVALVTDPASSALAAGSSRKFTYAPIANTGIAIAYYLDNVNTGQPITNLKLDARLVAKLLTNSYSYSFSQCDPGQTAQSQTCDPAVIGNPKNIFQDPEFYQLNPEYSPGDFEDALSTEDDTEPLAISGPSDMTYELTRWIESDPDAAAFLAGQPDPWGMHVNTYFESGETYPISDYSKLDPGFSQTVAEAKAGPAPQFETTMQAVWNPVAGQDNVDQDMLGYQSSGTTFYENCTGGACEDQSGPSVYNYVSNDQETLGARSLFAVVDTGDAGLDQFPTAQLVNSAGNAVGPTVDGMTAALDSMKTNPDKITQYQDFSDTSPNAYPLTEVQYAMVPTCGLTSGKARAISDFLNDAADSQLIGTSSGELPVFGGYLPLNAAQQAQDATAAQQVSTQSCVSPPPDNTVSGGNPGNNGASGGSGTGGSSGAGTSPGTVAPSSAGIPSGSGSGLPSGSPTVKATPSTEPVGLGMKGADDGGLAKVMLPIALILGGALLLGGPIAYAMATSGGGGSSFPGRRGAAPGPASTGTSAPEAGADGGAGADGAGAGAEGVTPPDEGGADGGSAAGDTDD